MGMPNALPTQPRPLVFCLTHIAEPVQHGLGTVQLEVLRLCIVWVRGRGCERGGTWGGSRGGNGGDLSGIK